MFAAIHATDVSQTLMLECAREFSPCVESTAPGIILLDLQGTEKLLGQPQDVGKQIAKRSKELGFEARVAIALNPDAAQYAALGFSGTTFIPSGQERQKLAALPVHILTSSPEMLETLGGWGIRTFAELASLPTIALTQRLGQEGLRLQKLARGGNHRHLVTNEVEENFSAEYEFDDPVETLESLSFILNRLTHDLCERLSSHALATTELRLRLELETYERRNCEHKQVYEHVWKPPRPTSDAKFLCRLACLDLNEVTFDAPIKKVSVEVVPSRPRSTQSGLFAPASPEPEKLEITLARIRGVVGSADDNGTLCVGSPQVLDSHKPDSFTVQSFSTQENKKAQSRPVPALALRLFRPELESSVQLTGDRPHFVRLWKKHRRVVSASGPWSSSGYWWNQSVTWMRDEWDVALKMSKGKIELYRICLDRIRGKWFVQGVFD